MGAHVLHEDSAIPFLLAASIILLDVLLNFLDGAVTLTHALRFEKSLENIILKKSVTSPSIFIPSAHFIRVGIGLDAPVDETGDISSVALQLHWLAFDDWEGLTLCSGETHVANALEQCEAGVFVAIKFVVAQKDVDDGNVNQVKKDEQKDKSYLHPMERKYSRSKLFKWVIELFDLPHKPLTLHFYFLDP